MYTILTETERSKLLSRHNKEKEKRIADRMKAVLLFDEGRSYEKITEALFLDDSTARLYIKKYIDRYELTLGHKGSTPLLTETKSAELDPHLTEYLYLKIKNIQEHIRITYNKELGISTLHGCLKKHKFSFKKPKLVPINADPKAQKAFINHYNEVMLEGSLEGDSVLFGDTVHPTQQTRLSYRWVKRGQEKLIEVNSGRKRINIMGALMLKLMRFTYKGFDTTNGQSAIDFLKVIEETYPAARTIHFIWNQASYHTCKEVGEYLTKSRTKVYFLPPRSPNLNAIEPLWKVMHEYVSNNRSYNKFQDFRKELFTFFYSTIPNIFNLLVSQITDNFHIRSFVK